jgi:hypothetical protein
MPRLREAIPMKESRRTHEMYTWDLVALPTVLVVWQVSLILTADIRTLSLFHHRQILAANIALPVALLQRCAALALLLLPYPR